MAAKRFALVQAPSWSETRERMQERSDGTTHQNAPPSLAVRSPLAFHFVHPPELDGLVIDLEDRLELGREAPSVVVPPLGSDTPRCAAIPHATVSRTHAALGESIRGNVPTLVDRGGRNGTFVDGAPLGSSVALRRHAVVRFGDAIAVVDERSPALDGENALPGRSPVMARVREALPRVARDGAPLLILGETGTGKEMAAAEVHRQSGRAGPLLRFNCAELSAHLVESQLFGHERGAFTGATSAHTGLFVAAEGGTLFLDEVSEIPVELQAKLLRVLQESEVRPLGSTQTRRIDVRVVCATNAKLLEHVESGRFRRDLYARLSFLELVLPPLRERKQDILAWIEHFRRRFCADRGTSSTLVFGARAAERVLTFGWPDNLRGLNRLVHRLLTVSPAAEVGMRSLEEAMPELFAAETPSASEQARAPGARPVSERPTREAFLEVYRATGESVRATSKHFGRDRRQIYRWLEQFGIERRARDDDD